MTRYRIEIIPPEASQGDDEIIFPSREAAEDHVENLEREGTYPVGVELEVYKAEAGVEVTRRVIAVWGGPGTRRRVIALRPGEDVFDTDMTLIYGEG